MESIPPLTRSQVRELDRRAIEERGVPGVVLMENAGRGAVDCLCRLGVRGGVAILCGKGNNAGDGFVMARHLDLRGHRVVIFLASDPDAFTGDAAIHFQIVKRSGIAIRPWESGAVLADSLRGFEWIVDSLLGTGAVGAPRPPISDAIVAANAAPGRKFAVDLPSGLDADSGLVSPITFQTDHSCTFVAPKPGMLTPEAAPYVGTIHVVDIGAPRDLTAEYLGADFHYDG